MDFDKLIDRFGSECEKWDGAKDYFHLEGVTPLWVADMDFHSAKPIQKALQQRIDHNLYGYTKKDGNIIKEIKKWLKHRHQWSVSKKHIAVASGVVTSLNVAINAFSNKGDAIVIQPPVYHPFARSIKANDRVLRNNPLRLVNGKYEIDFDDLEVQLKGAKMFILCNPQNPTGKVFSKSELKKIAKLCIENGVMIFSDEIHFDIVFAPCKHIPMASLSNEVAQITLTATAASKTFNIAGCSTSYVICENESLLRRYKQTSKKYIADDGNLFGVIATQAAYHDGEKWVDALLEYLRGNVEFVTRYIRKKIPQVEVINPQSTYLMWLDFRKVGKHSDEIKKILWEDAKAGLIDGRVFGMEGDGFFRLNIGTQRAILKSALKRIKEAL
jgi:cystathionine beta-lyase